MAKFKFTERNVALLCAIVLILVSATAAWREYYRTPPTTKPDSSQIQTGSKKEQKDEREVQDLSSVEQQSTTDITAADQDDQARPSTQDDTNTQDTTSKDAKSQTSPGTTADIKSSSGVQTFTAEAGSSYTEFARDALTAYAEKQQLVLSDGALLNAEVALTNAAGAPELEIGQQVAIAISDIKAALQSAGITTTTVPQKNQPESTDPITRSSDTVHTAVNGDSYTQLIRDQISRHLHNESLSLTPAQRVAAETFATQAAGTPYLAEGQTVTIPAVVVQQAVEQASQLDTTARTAWQPYADTIAW